MFYYINKKIIYINPLERKNIGTEGKVYRRGDKAIKIYHSIYNDLNYMQSKDKRLSTISTNYIIMPEEGVFSIKGRYCGYTQKYIEGLDSKTTSILDATSKDLKENLYELREDVIKLSQANFLMSDAYVNTFYNGKVYILDTSRYIDLNNELELYGFDRKNILKSNLNILRECLIYLTTRPFLNMSSKTIDERAMSLFEDVTKIDQKLGTDETIREYILRK